MKVISLLSKLPSLLMNKCSSVFLASDTVILSFLKGDNFITRLLRLVLQLIYFAAKWMMYMVDVMYHYVMQLAGVNVDASIFDSARSDMTFRLLLDNKEMVTDIIKNMIAIALILIIVTAIIAIIKQQFSSLKEKKAKKSPTGDVMRSVLKSFVLIFLTPLIALLGIVASSVILQSLFNATNLADTKSLSARVFNASASAANKYRIYAENGVRIPIKYKFSGENKEKAVNYAVEMIGNENFPSIAYFDVNGNFINNTFVDPVLNEEITRGSYKSGTDAWLNDTYYEYFDTSDDYSKVENSINNLKIMKTHVNEYYAMADVISYALDTMEPYYFITIQELLESAANLGDSGSYLKSLLEGYNIRLLDANKNVIGMSATTVTDLNKIVKSLKGEDGNTYSYISYTSKYKSGSYTYIHIKDARDEMEGAKFIVAYQNEIVNEDIESINGDYIKVGSSLKPVEKYFYKESPNSRYKKVDLYYYFNANKQEFVKAPSYPMEDSAGNPATMYYKIGEDYFALDSTNYNKFYYKDHNGNYQHLTLTAGDAQKFTGSYTTYYYRPLVEGVPVGNNPTFTTEYMDPSQIITARGLFDNSSYPTAIRRTIGGDIMFYRDDLELVSNGSVKDFATLEQIDAESSEADSGGIETDKGIIHTIGSTLKAGWNSVKTFASTLFNPLKLVPDLQLNPDAMSTTYTKKTSSVFLLKEGKLHISYFFADNFTSALSAKMYGMNLNCLFDSMSINYIVLVVGASALFKIIITAVFGLINRSFHLFILILIYPVACATLPFDEASGAAKSSSYAKWTKVYTQYLFSTYGLILGINFVFIILPVIDEITFFTAQNLQDNRALGRIADALRNPLLLLNIGVSTYQPNYVLSSAYLNKILRIIFQIAAFSLVTSANGKGESFNTVIQTVVGTGPDALKDSPMDAVKKTLQTMAQGFNMVFFPHKAVKNALEKGKETLQEAVDFIPGSAVVKEGVERLKQVSHLTEMDAARKELLKAVKPGSGASKEEVESKLKRYQDANKAGK